MSQGRNEGPVSSSGAESGPAWREALRLIGRRPLTVAELRRRLEDRGHASSLIDQVVEGLVERGYLHDAELARNFIVSRAQRLGHGPRRLVDDLVRRGVSREAAGAAWTRAVEQGDLDGEALLRRELRRRLGPASGELDSRTQRRVYTALVRAGFEGSAVHRELMARRGSATHSDHELSQGFDDDFV